MRTSIEAFSVIPHVDPAALAGRTLSTGTFYTDGEWTLWTSIDGKFHPLKIVDLAEGVYFGDAAAAPHDLGLNALNLIAQHTCNGTTMRPFVGIWDDIYNIAASIAKIDLISEARSTLGTKAGRMVITEVEYLAIQCRSIFDYVQEILRSQWSTVYSLEDGSKSKRKLPGSFGDVVLENGQPRTSQDIQAKYLLPPHLADVYAYHAPFFSTLKKMRDAIVHNAANPKEHVYNRARTLHRRVCLAIQHVHYVASGGVSSQQPGTSEARVGSDDSTYAFRGGRYPYCLRTAGAAWPANLSSPPPLSSRIMRCRTHNAIARSKLSFEPVVDRRPQA